MAFDRQSEDRISRAVRKIEKMESRQRRSRKAVTRPPGTMLRVKLDAAISTSGGTATASIWKWNGSAWEDTGENITVREFYGLCSGDSLASGDVCLVALVSGAGWCIIGAECSC